MLFSLVVARLLTPLLAAYFLKPGKGHGVTQQPATRDRVLEWTLRHRWTSLFAGIAIFVASLGVAAMLPSGFMPHDDNGFFQLIVRGSPGAVASSQTQR